MNAENCAKSNEIKLLLYKSGNRSASKHTYEVCPESNENGIPMLPTAVGGEGQV
jgi:hypothetical protein